MSKSTKMQELFSQLEQLTEDQHGLLVGGFALITGGMALEEGTTNNCNGGNCVAGCSVTNSGNCVAGCTS
jgi:hypothetical protein